MLQSEVCTEEVRRHGFCRHCETLVSSDFELGEDRFVLTTSDFVAMRREIKLEKHETRKAKREADRERREARREAAAASFFTDHEPWSWQMER